MNVIFLDIDGVMNSQLFYERRHKRRWLKPITYWWKIKSKVKWIFNGFKYKYVSYAGYKTPQSHKEFPYLFNRLKEETESLKWKWLSELCNINDYKICISSVWKNHFNNDWEWNKALMLLGFNDGIFVGITRSRETLRGTEIKNWIDDNNLENPDQRVEKYAIIDDDSDMLSEQMGNFFLSDGYCGLSPSILYRIKRHFKK